MTSKEPVRLCIATEFSRTPGPRRTREGEFSGERFLELLRERYLQARGQDTNLIVDLDGAAGYATSFLEASFGGLARDHNVDPKDLLARLQLKSDDEPDLIPEIQQYIREAHL